MSLSENNGNLGTTMLVSPTGNVGGTPYPVYMGGGQGGNGGFGNDGGW